MNLKNFTSALILSCALFTSLHAQKLLVTKGLLLDLNANKGIEVEDGNRIKAWKNQVPGSAADIFVKQDKGRDRKLRGKKAPIGVGTGRPTLKKNVTAIGGHQTVIFKEQELVNHQEDVFDHLTQGSGYTWFSVMCVYKQVRGKKDVNSFFGNLKNGAPYAGFWGNLMDDNRVWLGTRTGKDFGLKLVNGKKPLWHPELNPQVISKKPLIEKKYYLIMGRMAAGQGSVDIELFINSTSPVDTKQVPIDPKANPSKMAIGQERDAINHPGAESFHGEIARLMIYERPLTDEELKKVAQHLKSKYHITE